jgi:hypothetical protein
MIKDNPWELYSSVRGWELTSKVLTLKLDVALIKLDKMVATGTPVGLATNAIFNEMLAVMDRIEKYGANDSEPRSYLAQCLQHHIRKTHHVSYYVDRFGDITEA